MNFNFNITRIRCGAGDGQREESPLGVICITRGIRSIEWQGGIHHDLRVTQGLAFSVPVGESGGRARGVMGARWPVQLEGAGSNPVGSTVSQFGRGLMWGDSGQGVPLRNVDTEICSGDNRYSWTG